MKRTTYLMPLLVTFVACSGTPTDFRAPASADGVKVYLPNKPEKMLPAPDKTFQISSQDDKAAIEDLRTYLISHKADIALKEAEHLNLKLKSVLGTDGRYSVRFEQLLERGHGNHTFDIAISGAGVVAMLTGGKLTSVVSSLESPPNVSFVWKNPGFDLSGFSDLEFQSVLNHMKSAPNGEQIREYFARAARNSHLSFDMEDFNKQDFETQKLRLKKFFGGLGPVTTLRAIIDLARKNRIALVNYGGNWMFEVTNFFEVPVQFDMEITTDQSHPLKVKNFRELAHGVSINVANYPNYPNGPGNYVAQLASENSDIERSSDGGKVAGLFLDSLRYFKSHFSWIGFDGRNQSLAVNVYMNANAALYAENAMWHPGEPEGHFIIGAGGPRLAGFFNSISTVGHEFAHAITAHSSGLQYRGQSGGLNEHFSDIQGVSIESEVRGKPFDYTIGEDVISADMVKQKTLLGALILAVSKTPNDEIQKFNLLTPALRNLYMPKISYNAQPETVAEGESYGFGATCQPNQNNDNCGVHYLSGIPNKAVSLIISKLGFERTRNLLFRTGVLRLTANSNFQEYARQMMLECQEAGELNRNSECPVIAQSFAAVGVQIPGGAPQPQPQPQPNPEPRPNPQPNPEPVPQSPVLQFCGWISDTGASITVIDNKFDAAILISGNTLQTTGDFNDIHRWTGTPHACGCVWGRISQTANSRGRIFNYFLNVTKTKMGTPAACQHDGLVFR